ncbi:MAG: glycosyltransferase family 39 protein [Deltaproteobacteria bacterium]|nr:glycosyltransferase family 39 protein [Deltaproteobacteria bacterium]
MKSKIPLAAVLVLALYLRIQGTSFGLPHLYYWDEPTVVNRAVRFGSGDLNPHFFAYPTLYMYVLALVSGLTFVAGKVAGLYHGAMDFAVGYFTDPSAVYQSARVATALVGTAGVLLTYHAGKRFFGPAVGLLGALFLSVSVLHSTHSHVAITDVPHGVFVVAALLPLHAVLTRGGRRDYVLAGLLIGLGVATKYLAGLHLAGLVLAHLLRHRAARTSPFGDLPSLLLGGAALLGGFFVGAPYCFLDFGKFRADLTEQAALSAGGDGWSAPYFLLRVLPGDLGLPMLLLAGVGLVLAVRERKAAHGLFLSFPALYFLFVTRYPKAFARYMIPEDPFLALLAAYALVQLSGRLQSLVPSRQRVGRLALAMLVGAALLPPLITNLRWNRLILQTDPRTDALAWARRTLPADAVVAIQPLFERTFFNVPLTTDRSLAYIDQILPAGRFGAAKERIFTTLRAEGPVFREADYRPEPAELERQKVECVFTSSLNGPVAPDFMAYLKSRCPEPQVFTPSAQAEALPWRSEVLPVEPPTITAWCLTSDPAPHHSGLQ